MIENFLGLELNMLKVINVTFDTFAELSFVNWCNTSLQRHGESVRHCRKQLAFISFNKSPQKLSILDLNSHCQQST